MRRHTNLQIIIALSSFWDVFQVLYFLFDKPICLITGFPAEIAPGFFFFLIRIFFHFSMYHQSVPKPWTGSSSTASWAPIRAPTSTSTREQESKASSAIISEATKKKKLSGASGTSLPNESSSKTDLEQAIQDLDSFLVQGSFQEANMQSSLTEVEAKDEENNNETASSATPSKKMSASAVQELDDLTKQLMEALDTNEVIGDQDAKKQSPFGKS